MLPLPIDTKRALGLADDAESAAVATACESRSLLLDRYANPQLKDADRSAFFASVAKRACAPIRSSSWLALVSRGPKVQAETILFAQLQSRLLVNMAGGVMENAGLCLDRFGLPYIPGSAVKGCARRAALAALHEWCDTGTKPVSDDNLFTLACAPFHSPAEMIAAIARVFGWSEQDWISRSDFRTDDDWKKKRSDFAWACGDAEWGSARLEPPLSKHFAGNVSFLAAHPVNPGKVDGLPMVVPPLGQLELDVVTCHHGKYYASKDPNKKATDTEEPVPVVFPAIAPGHVFAFALLPLRHSATELLKHARTWLACGLQTFGLGAKTAAGYGWFEDVSLPIRLARAVLQREQAEQESQRVALAERAASRATLQPDLELIEILRRMKEPDLRGQINPFATEDRFWSQKDERVQLTLLHFLCVTAPDLLATDRANPASKIAKAITKLSAKFPHIAPTKT